MKIGDGGFGLVKSAEWNKRETKVALKSLKTFSLDEKATKEFVKEINLLHSVKHKNIIKLFGVIIEREKERENDASLRYTMVLQFADGGNLRSYLEHSISSLTWSDIIRMAIEITDGLKYLHSNNIIHRDLHDKNILVNEETMMIADFGLSKKLDDPSTSTPVRGMYAFVDPQCFDDKKYKLNKKSDIYSLGNLLWEITSGIPPFETSGLSTIMSSDYRETPIEGTPLEYIRLYQKCWDKDPNKRPADIQEIFETLDEISRQPNDNILKVLVTSSAKENTDDSTSSQYSKIDDSTSSRDSEIDKLNIAKIMLNGSNHSIISLACYSKATHSNITTPVAHNINNSISLQGSQINCLAIGPEIENISDGLTLNECNINIEFKDNDNNSMISSQDSQIDCLNIRSEFENIFDATNSDKTTPIKYIEYRIKNENNLKEDFEKILSNITYINNKYEYKPFYVKREELENVIKNWQDSYEMYDELENWKYFNGDKFTRKEIVTGLHRGKNITFTFLKIYDAGGSNIYCISISGDISIKAKAKRKNKLLGWVGPTDENEKKCIKMIKSFPKIIAALIASKGGGLKISWVD